ncbi:hypothetical protein GW17_00053404 [Ensete ventricosum]|uniref:Uncharacterized protein n=1 Tax=Ensete ventricosum TaxID=4639 RepID=A0A444CGA3_ENSVE|nr:hypothetical protein GW17_00053404 [Ensete ventricosum]RZR75391.1 hypothetical protein BHM03_00056257 [Ensete ventricosum]
MISSVPLAYPPLRRRRLLLSSSASLRSISFPRSLGSDDSAGSRLGVVARSIQLEVERGHYLVEAFRDLEAMVVGQQARKAMLGECPKKVARLIDLVNLPSNLREFAGGQSQMAHLGFFIRVWSHIKTHNLQVFFHHQLPFAIR